MNKILPYILLVLGVGIAAAFGARNGDTLTDYRAATWRVSALGVEDPEEIEELRESGVLDGDLGQAREVAQDEAEDIGLPAPGQRLSEWLSVGGIGWGLGILLVIVGAFLARRQRQAEHSGESEDGGGVGFQDSVRAVLERLEALQVEIAELPMDDDAPEVRQEIDDINAELLVPIVDARGRYVARHGLGVFAEYFGHFAGGERLLARTWSALTDGHAVVARESLDRSIEYFRLSLESWEAAERQSAA